MILRIFARLHARWRRWFFRFQRWQRYAISVGFIVGIVALTHIVLAVIFARSFPLLDTSADLNVLWNDQVSLQAHPQIVSSALSMVTSVSADHVVSSIDAIMQTKAAQYGLIIHGQDVILYAMHPLLPLGDLPEGWHVTSSSSDNILTLSNVDNRPSSTRFFWQWWIPLRLEALQSRFPLVAYAQLPALPPFYGVMTASDQGWDLALAPQSGPLRRLDLQERTVSGALALLRSQADLTPILGSSFVQKILPDVSDLWSRLLDKPVEVRLLQGVAGMAAAEPLSDTVAWQAILRGGQEAAQSWLQATLNDLMVTFPLAEERVLPDKSKVYELKRKPDFFIPEGKSIDLQTDPVGTLTFPHDQMRYEQTSDGIAVQKGMVPEDAMIWQACVLPQPLFDLGLEANAVGTSLWKTLYFGLDKEKMAVCIRW